MTGSLSLHVEQVLDGEAAHDDGGEAIASIIPMAKIDVPDDVELNDLVIPAGPPGQVRARRIKGLPAGKYMVRVRLPSGRVMDKTASVKEGDDQALTFEAERSPSETLSWQAYAGGLAEKIERKAWRERRLDRKPSSRKPVRSYDDLKQIKGIGPAIELALNQVGVGQISQIANFGTADLDRLAQTMSPYLKRLKAARWVDQAADLVSVRAGDAGAADAADDTADEADAIAQPTAQFFYRRDGDPGGGNLLRTLAELIYANRESDRDVLANASGLSDRLPATMSQPRSLTELARHGADGALTGWSLPADGRLGVRPRIRQRRPLERIYVVAHDGLAQWFFTLPMPWNPLRGGRPVGVDITFDRTEPEESGISMVPRHARVASLLGFMQAGDVRASRAILRDAKDLLFDKVVNPYAAAAGGSVLINALRWGGGRADRRSGKSAKSQDTGLAGRWDRWLENLANWYPWLPDAKIYVAWYILLSKSPRLTRSDHKTVRDLLLAAAAGGLPVYTGAFRLLVDGLKFLKGREREGSTALNRVSEALDAAMTVSMRIDTRQVFTTVRLTPRDRTGLDG